mmetsp:Transcript_28610/g.68232  ORF Transcript_28610/g.68232 Transcript_28610/m.68232 type:complete len:257 (+) Transcript_28610:274-1044(+)
MAIPARPPYGLSCPFLLAAPAQLSPTLDGGGGKRASLSDPCRGILSAAFQHRALPLLLPRQGKAQKGSKGAGALKGGRHPSAPFFSWDVEGSGSGTLTDRGALTADQRQPVRLAILRARKQTTRLAPLGSPRMAPPFGLRAATHRILQTPPRSAPQRLACGLASAAPCQCPSVPSERGAQPEEPASHAGGGRIGRAPEALPPLPQTLQEPPAVLHPGAPSRILQACVAPEAVRRTSPLSPCPRFPPVSTSAALTQL